MTMKLIAKCTNDDNNNNEEYEVSWSRLYDCALELNEIMMNLDYAVSINQVILMRDGIETDITKHFFYRSDPDDISIENFFYNYGEKPEKSLDSCFDWIEIMAKNLSQSQVDIILSNDSPSRAFEREDYDTSLNLVLDLIEADNNLYPESKADYLRSFRQHIKLIKIGDEIIGETD